MSEATTASLAEVCDFIRDGTHGSPERTTSGTPVLSAEHVQDGFLSYASDRFTSAVELRAFRKRLHPQPGDVLLTIVGTIGRVAIVTEDRPCVFQRSVCVLRPMACRVDTTYLRYSLESSGVKQQIERETRQVAQAGIYLESLSEIAIPLPPLTEQRRIAAQLEQADRLRRTRRYTLDLSDTFLPATFRRMFGDPKDNPLDFPTPRLADICLKFSDGPFGSNLKSEHYTQGGVRVVRLQNIGVGSFDATDSAFVSEEHFASLPRHRCIPGDVLIGTLGDPNLRACIQPNDLPRALNKADCIQARVDPKLAINQWLCWLLNMPSTMFLVPGMVHGQTRSRISMGELAELPVPLPPLAQQRAFAAIVAQHERLRATQRESLRQAEHLFQTQLHRAFAS